MRIKRPLAIAAALAASLAVPPAGAALVEYSMSVPGVGAGSFAYDDASLVDAGGDFTSALMAFSFAYNGWTYGLGDATSALAWLYSPGPALGGIQYLGTHNADTIEFAAGFGSGDMGTFTGNGGAPTGVGPITLTDADFVQQVPEPATLACLLLGIGLMSGARRRGWRQVSW
ncbi:PEP-CTERM sorting domain-containing protein [uncultured Thiodictyon sp.]|jgi:hypothetical protein|uniref:PEP-CTERM sorting domain-containing protein n=1 Tax=uncultured Thiodictyon sp. TaxID=1846217 RepID=UPI0025FC14AD|nr:PEP-CTERM sorting domain-containing protein [uncultured Thiodictyon sp.]